MLSKVIIKKKNVLPLVLLDIIVQFSIVDANCADNLCIFSTDNETFKNNIIHNKNIPHEEEQNNENISNCNNTNNHIVEIEFQSKNDDLNKLILENNNLLSIDHVLGLLWSSYKHIFNTHSNDSNIRIVSIHDNIIQKYINNISKCHNILSSKRKEFKSKKNNEIVNRTNSINHIRKALPSIKKIKLRNFLKKEIINFSNNIEHVTNINKQHELVRTNKIIIDTYFKIQNILSNNKKEVVLNIDTDYKNIDNKLNIFQQEVLENINSFYDSCLIGNVLRKEAINDNLDIINNRIIELETNPGDVNNILKIVKKLEVNTKSKEITNKLKTLQSKVKELAAKKKLKNITNNLVLLNRKIFRIKLNVNLQAIKKNNLKKHNTIENITTIIPTTSNIFCWCSENYEDWEEILSKHEKTIIDIFNYKLNNKQINKQEFANTFFLLHKIADINTKIENYYYTAKLLCNLSPITKKPHPIILPRSLAV